MTGHLTRVLLAGAASLLLALPHSAAQTPPETVSGPRTSLAFHNGTHAFRRILHDRGLKPLTSFADLEQAPQRSILIVYGDPRRSLPTRGGHWLQRFVDRGGAVLY